MGRTITTFAREILVFCCCCFVLFFVVALVDMVGAGRTCFHFHYCLLCGRLCSRLLLGLTVNYCHGNFQLHCWASALKVELRCKSLLSPTPISCRRFCSVCVCVCVCAASVRYVSVCVCVRACVCVLLLLNLIIHPYHLSASS